MAVYDTNAVTRVGSVRPGPPSFTQGCLYREAQTGTVHKRSVLRDVPLDLQHSLALIQQL